jgi:hypothetical protein
MDAMIPTARTAKNESRVNEGIPAKKMSGRAIIKVRMDCTAVKVSLFVSCSVCFSAMVIAEMSSEVVKARVIQVIHLVYD